MRQKQNIQVLVDDKKYSSKRPLLIRLFSESTPEIYSKSCKLKLNLFDIKELLIFFGTVT